MAERGKPSVAHEYDAKNQCIHCGMFQVNVLALSHLCTPAREAESDTASIKAAMKKRIG